MDGLVAEPVSALSEGQLARVQAIYEEAFRPDLRVPFGELTTPGRVDQTFVALEGAVPAGLAALRLLGSVQWSFLRYFAITGERRSQGLGRRFWRLLHPLLQAQAWPTRVVFEVEDPSEAAGAQAERVIRQRRMAFWTACGARLLSAPGYVLPDYTGSGVTEPMLLMAASPRLTAASCGSWSWRSTPTGTACRPLIPSGGTPWRQPLPEPGLAGRRLVVATIRANSAVTSSWVRSAGQAWTSARAQRAQRSMVRLTTTSGPGGSASTRTPTRSSGRSG